MTSGAGRGQLSLADGRAIGYREWGRADGPVLIGLHSVGETADSFRLVGPLLGVRFRVIAVDARGHGDSDWTSDYGVAAQAEDVVAVMDAIGVLAAVVLGHGSGGITALELAAVHPERVRALVLAQTPPPEPADPALPISAGPLPGETYDWRAGVALATWRNNPPPDAWDRAATVSCASLVLHGSRSESAPFDSERLARLIPRGKFAPLDAGAGMHEERPGEFAAVVLPFLAEAVR